MILHFSFSYLVFLYYGCKNSCRVLFFVVEIPMKFLCQLRALYSIWFHEGGDRMKKSSLSIKVFVSLAVFLVSAIVILNIVSNYMVVNNMKDEIGQNGIGKLKVASNMISQLKDTVKREALRLSLKSEVNNLQHIQKKKSIETEDLFFIPKVLDTMFDLVSTDNMYQSVYLYMEDVDRILTSNMGCVSESDMTDTGWIQYYKDYKENHTDLSWIDTRIPNHDTNGNEAYNPEYVITYQYPLTPYTTNLRGTIAVNIRESVISRRINSSDYSSEGYIMIVDQEGKVISHVQKDYLCRNLSDRDTIQKIIKSTAEEGYLPARVNGSESIVSYYKAGDDDWIYIGVFSLDNLIRKSKKTQLDVVYISLFLLTAGILTALYVSKRLSSPLKKLIQDIYANKDIDVVNSENEMDILNKAFHSLKRRDETLLDTLNNNKRNIEESYLYNLLLGNTACEANKNMMDTDFRYAGFLCAILSIDRYEEFIRSYETEQRHYVKMLILQVAEQVLNAGYVCKGINMEKGNMVLIINGVSDKDYQKGLKESFLKIQGEIGKVFDCTISVGIGNFCENKLGIRTSYMHALEAIRFKLKYGCGSILFWDQGLTEHKYYYPLQMEEHILNYLELRDKNGIAETVRSLVDELRDKKEFTCDNMMQVFNQLIGNTVVRYLMNSNINMVHIFGSDFNIYKELASKETLDDIQKWLIEIYGTIIEYCRDTGQSAVNNYDIIMKFIQKNYKKNIGISEIAEHVGLSYSHVRKIFRDETGYNIVDYINNLRINEAKDMLAYSDKNIKDIACIIGYNNDQSFTRAFKKLEGITPGEYRLKEQYQQNIAE